MRGASSVTVRGLEAQLSLEPLLLERVAEAETHGDHGLEASRGLEQMVEVVRTAQAVSLLQDDWGLLDS